MILLSLRCLAGDLNVKQSYQSGDGFASSASVNPESATIQCSYYHPSFYENIVVSIYYEKYGVPHYLMSKTFYNTDSLSFGLVGTQSHDYFPGDEIRIYFFSGSNKYALSKISCESW